MNIRDFIKSFWDITRHIVFARRAKVLFYYPQHFNRSAHGTNPFFDALLETCEKNGISYKLIEEPDWGTDKPRNPKALKGDTLYLLILVLRKMVRCLRPGKPFYLNEAIVARILNVLTFGRLLYSKYISISGSLNELFLALNPKGQVFEMQHGIVYHNIISFFEKDGRLKEAYKNPNLHFLFWGEGYRQSVIRGHETELAQRTHVVGYPVAVDKTPDSNVNDEDKVILISLQFTADWDMPMQMQVKQMLIECLEELRSSGRQVLLKQHPRYNNAIDISDIYQRFDFVRETHESLGKLICKTFLHVTYFSTTAFEFAAEGVPSFFMSNCNFSLERNLFYSEYGYPIFKEVKVGAVIAEMRQQSNYKAYSARVLKWYHSFYTSYKEVNFINYIH